jgi:hypothetical protein
MPEVDQNAVEKGPRAAKLQGFSRDAKIYFKADEDGKKYGPKNNPRREGSAVAEHFANMKDGMTIQKAIDIGIPTGTIVKAYKKNWIDLEEPEGEAEAAE